MSTVVVIVKKAENVVKDDDGKRLDPHVQHELEETERVTRLIAGGVLEKVRAEDIVKKKDEDEFDADK